MRADRFLPVRWETTDSVLTAALQAGRRIIGIEDVGTKPLWGIDLTGPVLFVVGGESDGIPDATLERCDSVARIPMGGFIRSYNLQAAVAMAAGERMRQIEAADASANARSTPRSCFWHPQPTSGLPHKLCRFEFRRRSEVLEFGDGPAHPGHVG